MRSDQYSIWDSLEECEAIITTCEDSKFAPRGEVTWPLSRARLSAFTLIKCNSTSSLEKQVLLLLFNTLLLAEGRKKKKSHLRLITAMNSGIALQQQKGWVGKNKTKKQLA